MRSVVLGATVVVAAASFGTCADGGPPRIDQPLTNQPPIDRRPGALPVTPGTTESVVAGLTKYGVDVGVGVLIDVAGDGRDRFLEARRDGAADFGGTRRDDATLMVLHPAATTPR